jgi:hypothetical protein
MNSEDDTLAGGLPHSEIPGSPIARISPGLFAACHVLHRLSVPRHPPDALTSRLITGIPRHNHGSATTVRPRDAAPPPRTGPKLHPREGGDPYATASHEDTSRIGPAQACLRRRQAKLRFAKRGALRPEPIRLGHITTLSLHPSINTRAAVRAATLFAASPKRRWGLSAKPCFACWLVATVVPFSAASLRLSAGEAVLRRWWR